MALIYALFQSQLVVSAKVLITLGVENTTVEVG